MHDHGCPGENELAAFAVGGLPSDSRNRLAAHLEGCPSCRQRLEQGNDPSSFEPQAMVPVPALPSQVGDCAILEELGRGDLTVVYKARKASLDRMVAFKVLRFSARDHPQEVLRLRLLAEAMSNLHHSGIAAVHEVGEVDGRPYVVLDYVEGGSLAAKLNRSPMPIHQAVPLMETLARTIHEALQRRVIHGNLKPSNILLAKDDSATITDFNLPAQRAMDRKLPLAAVALGSLSYMAPEQAFARVSELGPSVDIYGLGAIFYEMLTGRPPFVGEQPRDVLDQVIHEDPVPVGRLNASVPADLETICLKCLRKEPRQRYATAEDLANDLQYFLEGEPIEARPIGKLEKAWRWSQDNPRMASLAAFGVLALVLVMTTLFWRWQDGEQARRDTENARAEASRTHKALQRQSAELIFDRGLTLGEQGQANLGLHWMLDGLQATPDDALEFRDLVRTNLAAWGLQVHELRQILEHKDYVYAVAFSPDGKLIATACADRTVRLWNAATGLAVSEPLQHAQAVLAVAFSPDGQMLLSGCSAGVGERMAVAQRWDLATSQPIAEPLMHENDVLTVAFSPDGKTILTGSSDRTARVWDAATGDPIGMPLRHENPVQVALFTPDGKTILTAQGSAPTQAAVQLWDSATGQRQKARIAHPSATVIACSADGKLVLTGAGDGLVRLWNTVTGETVGKPLQHSQAIRAAGFTPNGRTIAVCCNDGKVHLWDVATGGQLGSPLRHDGRCQSVAFSPDGRTIATTGTIERTARLWDLARTLSRPAATITAGSPRLDRTSATGTNGIVFNTLAYSPDRKTAITGSGQVLRPVGGIARLWDLASGCPIGVPLRHPWKIRAVAFSPDGKRVATSSQDAGSLASSVHLWDAITGKPLGQPLLHPAWVAALAFSPDGKVLALGDHGRNVLLWDIEASKALGKPLVQNDIALSLAFHPDGKTLAVGTASEWSRSPVARLWDVAKGEPIGEPMPHRFGVHWVAFSPDGKVLLTGADDHAARLWDSANGKPIGRPLHQAAGFRAAVFSPDSKLLLTGSGDGTVRLWQTGTGEPVGLPMLHASPVRALAFHPDGKLLVAGCENGSARLWETASGRPVGPPVVQRLPLLGVAFSADGRSFLSTAEDGASRVWPVPVLGKEKLDHVRQILEIHTGMQMESGRAVVPLNPMTWKERHQALVARGGEPLVLPAEEAAWHDTRTRDAEQDGAWFAVVHHLDRLIALRPNDWHLHARRLSAHALTGAYSLAEADYKQAEELGSPELVLSWCEHAVVDCQVASKWPAALWYLDRLIAARPREWQWHGERAVVHARLGKTSERDADLAQALELGADRGYLERVAEDSAARGDLNWAVTLYARAAGQNSLTMNGWHHYALLCLLKDNEAAYRKACTRIVQEVKGKSINPLVANTLSWICVLGPDAVTDYQPLIAQASEAVAKVPAGEKKVRHSILNTLGAVHYRAGRYQDAVDRLQEGIAETGGRGSFQDWVFLAMAHHRLDQPDEAGQWLDKALARPLPTSGHRSWDDLEMEILRKEAVKLIRAGNP